MKVPLSFSEFIQLLSKPNLSQEEKELLVADIKHTTAVINQRN